MNTDVKLILDSISPGNIRLTTFEITMPRIILAEFNTHRMFSRNTSSSRAIPTAILVEEKVDFTPETWWKNCNGMVPNEVVPEDVSVKAKEIWEKFRKCSIETATELNKLGIHKQIANRPLEPCSYVTTLVTATDWSNFLNLRSEEHGADSNFWKIVLKMKMLLFSGIAPTKLDFQQWHAPFTDDLTEDEFFKPIKINIDGVKVEFPLGAIVSVARCSRVSYSRHDGARSIEKDVESGIRRLLDGHMSPFEHIARPQRGELRYEGNFYGWRQFRKMIPHEHNISCIPIEVGT